MAEHIIANITDLTDVSGLPVIANEGDFLIWSTGWEAHAPAVVKAALGLDLVNNTADASKPVSTAQAAADAVIAATVTAHVTDTANPHAVTKTQVGLGNVDNTADTAKPVSTAQQTALDLKSDISSLSVYFKKDGSVVGTGAFDMGTHKITGVDTPTVASDATNKAYVDAAISAGVVDHDPVRFVAITGTLATGFDNGKSAGGVTVATGDRFLYATPGGAVADGVYIAAASGAPTRATDLDTSGEFIPRPRVAVTAGTYAGTNWTCTNAANPTLGVTALIFTQSGVGGTTYSADGTTMALAGGVFSVNAIPESKVTNLTTDLAAKALAATTITPAGLATGGGSLASNRTITVPKASTVTAAAGSNDTDALTALGAEAHFAAAANRGIDAISTTAPTNALGNASGAGQGTYWTKHAFELNQASIVTLADNTVAFDGQTGNFTVGQVVTGATSGCKGTIASQVDAGTTGTLTFSTVTPGGGASFTMWTDNEVITDPLGGHALVNGSMSVETTYENEAALSVLHRDAGFAYVSTTSVGKSAIGLKVHSERQNYLTDVQAGQLLGIKVDMFAPRLGDSAPILFSMRRPYVTGGVHQTNPVQGATSGIEGNIRFDDASGTRLGQVGTYVGHLPAFDNVAIEWTQQMVGMSVQLDSDSTIKGYAAYSVEENDSGTTDGWKYLFSAHDNSGVAPYFAITGQRLGTTPGPGNVNAGGGSALWPAYSYMSDLDTGMYNISSNVLGWSTGGTERARLSLNGLSLASGVVLRTDLAGSAVQVVGARKTGWGEPTATRKRAALTNASSATDVLQTLAALIYDLHANNGHGMIGT